MTSKTTIYVYCSLFTSFLFWHTHTTAATKTSLRLVDSLLVEHQKTGDGNVLNNAFIKLERYRNEHIRDELLACMPDSATAQVRHITKRFADLKNKMALMQARFPGNVPDDSLYAYQHEIDNYRKTIHRRYPHFSYFLAILDSLSILEVQKTLLAEKQAIVEYVVSERHVQAIVINRDTVHSISLSDEPQTLLSQARKLRSMLHLTRDPRKQTFDIELAYSLYKRLVAPLEPYFRNVQSVIILPGFQLWGLPFECLVTTRFTINDKSTGAFLYSKFRNVEFLIRRYAIAYNFSIIGLSTQLGDVYARSARGRKLLTMSVPVHADLDDERLSRYFHENEIHIQEEIRQISHRMWRNEMFSEKEATRDLLLRRGREFRWIHLALPVVIDIESPAESYIAFAGGPEQQNRNYMSVSDAMSAHLTADQIIMSRSTVRPASDSTALNLDLLPQALLLGGVRSVMWSRWQVAGNSVARSMSKFYWELKYKRETNMLALQQAKLRALSDTFLFEGVEIATAHPHFWASCMLIGNVNIRPPTFSTIPPYLVVSIVYIILLAVSLIIVRKTVDRNTKQN